MNATYRSLIVMLAAMLAYSGVVGPFNSYMERKPVEEKLGYVPNETLLSYFSADFKSFVAALLVSKATMYYGGIVEKQTSKVVVQPPDYKGMSRLLHGAVKLDPYNMDAYYFAQSFLTWEVGQYSVANNLLDYGMKYRNWDWYLPFFAGFNYAYFLKDYAKAAEYYLKAGELSGQELHISLTSRYLQESGQTEHAIAYLTVMLKGTRDETARRTYRVRLLAFQSVLDIEKARDRFLGARGRLPISMEELLHSGFLDHVPVDPYGGTFYLKSDGKVGTTSKFAYKVKK